MSQENPIPNGWHWNEAELPADDSLFSGLVTLMVIGHDLAPKLIGTAFLVTAEGYKATAISAAHCFSFAERIIHPEKKHHATTPSEFLPPPTEVDLKQVKAIYQRAGRIFVCPVELAIWDSATDLAVLTIVAPSDDPKLFENFFWIDNELPNVGDLVCMIGFGDLSEEHPPQQGIMRRRLVLRVGHVEQISHEPSQLLKSPSVRTSIAVYGGM